MIYLKRSAVFIAAVAAGTPYEGQKLPFEGIEYVEEGRAVQFDVEGQRWTCDLETYACTGVEKEDVSPGELRSPDGRRAAFVKEHNVHVRAVDGDAERTLTDDGAPYYDYATSPESNTHPVTQRLSGQPAPPLATTGT